MKSNDNKVVDPKCTLIHSKNMYKKDCKIAWSVRLESSMTLRFLSFHKVLKKHKGVTFHAFFSSLHSPPIS